MITRMFLVAAFLIHAVATIILLFLGVLQDLLFIYCKGDLKRNPDLDDMHCSVRYFAKYQNLCAI